jgi:hypothetical protein
VRGRDGAPLPADGHPRGAQHLGLQPQGARGRREGQPVAGSVLGAGGRGRRPRSRPSPSSLWWSTNLPT